MGTLIQKILFRFAKANPQIINRKMQQTNLVFQEGKPKVFWYKQQTLYKKTRKFPDGVYVIAAPKNRADAKIRVRNPLVLEWGAPYGKKSWTTSLSERFEGKIGPALSRAVVSHR